MSINKLHMAALVAWLFHVVPLTANMPTEPSIAERYSAPAMIRRLPVPSKYQLCPNYVPSTPLSIVGSSKKVQIADLGRIQTQHPTQQERTTRIANPTLDRYTRIHMNKNMILVATIRHYFNILTVSDSSLVLHSTYCRRWLKCQEKSFQRTFLNALAATKYRAVSWAAQLPFLHPSGFNTCGSISKRLLSPSVALPVVTFRLICWCSPTGTKGTVGWWYFTCFHQN